MDADTILCEGQVLNDAGHHFKFDNQAPTDIHFALDTA